MRVISLHAQPTETIVAHDGDGSIDFVRLSDRFPMLGAWEFVDFARVPPGASVGLHEHAHDEEVYVILAGAGIITVNGADARVNAFDVVVNPPFATHGIRNDGSEPLEFVVLKVPAR
jgi:oxalate decarboxylase/phosphoglucose isomerase-like protein (cupin superfamily)